MDGTQTRIKRKSLIEESRKIKSNTFTTEGLVVVAAESRPRGGGFESLH